MTCYVIPALAAIVYFILRKTNPKLRTSTHQLWLNQLFLGGAIFGVVDHLWNGELFLFGPHPAKDLALGITITLVIVAVWGVLVVLDKHVHKQKVVV